MSRRFWHLACVNPKTGRVVPLSETDADHLEKFWDANAGTPIKRGAQTSKLKRNQKRSPTGKVTKAALNVLKRRFKNVMTNPPTSPETPIRIDGSQEYRFGTDVKPPPPPFTPNGGGGDSAAPTAVPQNLSREVRSNGKASGGTHHTDVPPPPQDPEPRHGDGPALTPIVPRILYVDECAQKNDRKLTYDAIMLHKAGKWWFVVPRKGGLYENKVCKKHRGLPLLSIEWWRLAFCGYETKKERTAVTSLRDICM